ncbi:MAG TPA: hypothetical protein VMR17_03725 [Xanthobacteraceae bacterium]|nr:hypothetical protein [Xanthobacteraceae bacterium]
MRFKITMGIAALALGTALASGTAFAQSYGSGKAANDGGYTGSPNTPSSRDGSAAGAAPIYNYAPQQQATFHYPTGKAANDGGMIH